jgi:hypothetical protein
MRKSFPLFTTLAQWWHGQLSRTRGGTRPRQRRLRRSRLICEGLEERLVPSGCSPNATTHFAGFGAVAGVEQTLDVRAGDQVEVRMKEIDDESPLDNEAQEGADSAAIWTESTDGGETFQVSDYDVEHTFVYAAARDCETFTSQWTRTFPSDASGLLSVTVLTPQPGTPPPPPAGGPAGLGNTGLQPSKHFSPTTKQLLLVASAAVSLAGVTTGLGEGVLALNVLDGLTGNPLYLALKWTAGSEGAADSLLVSLLLDPPDPQFTRIPAATSLGPHRLRLGHAHLTPAEGTALSALLAAETKATGLGVALDTALNRADGAAAAHDLFAETRQLVAAAHYAGLLRKVLRAEPRLLARAERALTAAGQGKWFYTAADVRAMQQRVAQDGLPPSLADALQQLGVGPAEADRFRQGLLALDPAAVPTSPLRLLLDPRLLAALGDEADALQVLTQPTDVRDVSSLVSVSRARTGGGAEVETIRNVSGQPLTGPLTLVFENLGRAFNPPFRGGVIRGPDPFVTVPVPGGVLQPGGSVSVAVSARSLGHGGRHVTPAVLASQS